MSFSLVSPVDRRIGGTCNRRELLRVGGLSLLGLTTPGLASVRANSTPASAPRANSCVFIFLFGGPSQIDLWDMKPDAPAEIRGEFKPIATKTPGVLLCEHLPKLAGQTDKLCLLRSMSHHMPVHGPACSEIYTGREYFGPPVTDEARGEDWPSIASLVMRFGKPIHQLPPSLVLPWYSQFSGQAKRIAGQTGGRMSDRYSPVLIEGDPSRKDFSVPGLKFLADVDDGRISRRRDLLTSLKTFEVGGVGPRTMSERTDMAYSMLSKPAFQAAFDLQGVPEPLREQFGYTKFGQSLLLASRLVEAGVSLVTVNWDDETKHDKVSPFWDTHHENFAKLKNHLCPVFDRAFSAFLETLAARGLLDSTLVVVSGEFGRTPKIGKISQNAMTQPTGRDHFPHAFTVLLAGGGVRGGAIYGATSSKGDRVIDRPVSPADLAATIFRHLGVDAEQHYFDHFQNIPRKVCEGTPIVGLG